MRFLSRREEKRFKSVALLLLEFYVISVSTVLLFEKLWFCSISIFNFFSFSDSASCLISGRRISADAVCQYFIHMAERAE
jgi:hypothetical protein